MSTVSGYNYRITVEFDINNSAEEADMIQDQSDDAPGEVKLWS